MIGEPYNDGECLGAVTAYARERVAHPGPGMREIASWFRSTALLAAWIRELPQRNDDGDPADGPRVSACDPSQRLRLLGEDPNCFERAWQYLILAELIDPTPVRQLATLDFPWGRHTIPLENGAPIVVDPRATYQDLVELLRSDASAMAAARELAAEPMAAPPADIIVEIEQPNRAPAIVHIDGATAGDMVHVIAPPHASAEGAHAPGPSSGASSCGLGVEVLPPGHEVPPTLGAADTARNGRRARIVQHARPHSGNTGFMPPSSRSPYDLAIPGDGDPRPVAIEIGDALAFTTELAQQAAGATRNGPSRAYVARNAIQGAIYRGEPPTDPHVIESIGWFLSQAERVARDYGPRALKIVRTSALAISDLIDDLLAQARETQPKSRNLSFEIGGHSYGLPSWLSSVGSLAGRIGLNVGALALSPKLASLGITENMLGLVEQELNAEGYSLGPLVNPKNSFSRALTPLSRRRSE